MGLIIRGSRVASRLYRNPALLALQQRSASRASIPVPFAKPPFPTLEECPSPTCQCRETPSGLDIEREQNLNGSMAAYAEQVLISTGTTDWKSRIQDDDESVLVRQLTKFIGPKGKFSDVSIPGTGLKIAKLR